MGAQKTKDLGFANGWNKTPDIVKDCRKAGHRLLKKKLGRCWYEYTCPICEYKYQIDSGD